ncbi:developmental pluripotency-associated protein 4-like [Microcebus murinus]|uniref:developmental pluripotency-associated protein 4 n=1 Tax=Microcebus murinus TaxID=30608 RepID=UPI000642A9FC|nr:developmental pluripotency-associated protein 4 [Microcebus murinus]
MENARGKEWNATEKSREECGHSESKQEQAETGGDQQVANQQSTVVPGTSVKKGTKRKRSAKHNEESCPKKAAECNEEPKPRKKIPIPPLPATLPPVNLLHRDIVRAWCQQLKLSSKGQKLEVYRRLCEYAYPNQKDIPSTAKEAKIRVSSKRKSNVEKKEMSLKSSGQRLCCEGTDLPAVCPPPEEGLPALESASLLEGVNTVVVTTSAPEALLASWARTAARAGSSVEAVESPQENCDVRWCVVHGKSLPADTDGWVRLQFHAGQAWVPEKTGDRVSALFLLPSCNFPPPHLEDNMLCPTCVQRNKVLIKSLQWE